MAWGAWPGFESAWVDVAKSVARRVAASGIAIGLRRFCKVASRAKLKVNSSKLKAKNLVPVVEEHVCELKNRYRSG
jgi:hypothetical protein